ncbi:hypothetical protein JIX58_11015 [Brevundimonas diminuta]|uniref:hypothetical protein n=1 Tax=Brevundimonas TaxID=41275 RepID=UPI001906AE9A|nr:MULTISPECIES: hypothetical protein [Brevundimonas]MBK1976273.1 hypothetical protein [Brevundimonas diminuta]
MALKSSTFKVGKANRKTVGSQKAGLETRHKGAIEKVVSEARALAEDRRTTLRGISSSALRVSATR